MGMADGVEDEEVSVAKEGKNIAVIFTVE